MLFVAVAAAALAIGCSSSSNEPSGTVIEVVAQNTRFAPDVIEVPAGQKVTLRLKNLDGNEHDLEVRGLKAAVVKGGGHEGMSGMSSMSNTTSNVAVHTKAGKSATVEFQANEKGTYEVFCSMPGHEQSGMVAKLVVV